jgi:hypothetical protein
LISSFEGRVKPIGWWPSAAGRNRELKWMFLLTLCMIVLIISVLFGIGSFILLEPVNGIIYLSLATLSIVGLRSFLKKSNIFEHINDFQ